MFGALPHTNPLDNCFTGGPKEQGLLGGEGLVGRVYGFRPFDVIQLKSQYSIWFTTTSGEYPGCKI
jgi:hypothetical protein